MDDLEDGFGEEPNFVNEGGDHPDRPPLPEGYRYDAEGNVEWNAGTGDDDQWQFLCSPLIVVAATCDEHGENWGRFIRIRDREGNWHEWAMPNRMLSSTGDEYRKVLLDKGLDIASGHRARTALHDLLTRANPKSVRRCVDRLGWHDDAYVLPGRTVPAGQDIVFQSESGRAQVMRSRGTLEEWQEHVAIPAERSSCLILGICAAFAAPLLKIAGLEGGGIHLRGPSSIGKTTALLVAASVWGGGIRSWRTTDNGLEGIALEHCDRLLCLDELGQVLPDALGEAAYMLANGQGKTRASKDGLPRSHASWRLLFLSTGEVSLQDKIRESRRQLRIAAGQEIRIADVPADAGTGFGIFETVPEDLTAGQLADQLIEVSKLYFGTAGTAFLEKLVKNIEEAKDRITAIVERFVRENASETDGQVQRVARRFGLIAAAGELAIEWDILPYLFDDAYRAVQRCFAAWLAARGTTGPSEIERGLAQVRAYFEQYGASRFQPMDAEDAPVVHNRSGFRDGSTYYVLPQAWRDEICRGFDAKVITAELVKRGVIALDGDEKPQKAKRLPGFETAIRVYHVDLDKLFEGIEV